MSNYKLYTIFFSLLIFLLVSCQKLDTSPPTVAPEELPVAQASEVPPTKRPVVQEETAEQWHIIRRLNVKQVPGSVYFANPDFAISGCNWQLGAPRPSYTTDGGQTWEITGDSSTTSCPAKGIYIVDEQSIWSCYLSSNYWFVQDSYQTWNKVPNPTSTKCLLLSFADNENGWAVVGTTDTDLVATSDSGNSWEEIVLPEGIGEIAAISLRSSNDGYILDFDRTLYETHDGGKSWSHQTLELEDKELEAMHMGDSSAAIRFSDEDNGVVILNVAGGGNSALLALHTSDGGKMWDPHEIPTGFGPIYLSHDGRYLTVNEPGKDVVLLENLQNGN